MSEEAPAPRSSPYRLPPALIGKGSGVVLILILLVTVGVSLVARVVRDAANARSVDNLRQIVLATHECNDAYQEMPLVSGQWKGIPASNSTHRTLFFCLLPFIEQDKLYHSLLDSGPDASIDFEIPTYLNRRDNSAKDVQGGCSYAANWQVFQAWTGSVVTIDPVTGVFPQYASIPRSFPDGQINVVMFAEIYQNCNGTVRKWGQTGTATDFRTPAFNREGTQPRILNANLELPQFGPKPGDCLPALAQSPNSSGVLVGLADGSIRKIDKTKNLTTWQQMCCPADDNSPPHKRGAEYWRDR